MGVGTLDPGSPGGVAEVVPQAAAAKPPTTATTPKTQGRTIRIAKACAKPASKPMLLRAIRRLRNLEFSGQATIRAAKHSRRGHLNFEWHSLQVAFIAWSAEEDAFASFAEAALPSASAFSWRR